MKPRHRAARAFAVLAALGLSLLHLLPARALAHAPIEGMDGFWLGMRHPFTLPAQALAITALGVWLGWAQPQVFRRAWGAFNLLLIGALIALLSGLLPRIDAAPATAAVPSSGAATQQPAAASALSSASVVDPLAVPLLLLALIVALCAAIRPQWIDHAGGAAAISAAALSGLGLAWGTAPEPGAATALTMTVGGSVFVLNALLLTLFGIGDALRGPRMPAWTAVALRVLAAWLMAVTVMALALLLSG